MRMFGVTEYKRSKQKTTNKQNKKKKRTKECISCLYAMNAPYERKRDY